MLLQIQHLYRLEKNCAKPKPERSKDNLCEPAIAA
jgi:hypothetical protein